MTSIKLIVSGASARAEVDGLLTSGMVGIPVTIVCDGAWDGLTKSMVCRAGHIVKTILNVGNTATVAHECMVPNQTLLIGIEGRNADGTLVIPTIWARCGLICSGANADADPSTDPTLPVWARIESKIGSLDNLNTQAKENLVAAINEAMTKGGGTVDPEAVQKLVEDYLAANPPTVTETDPTVPAWAKEAQKPSYTAGEVGADPSGTAASKVAEHNTGADAHSDIRLLIQGMTDRLNALADSDDTMLDQLSEVVAYIKSNRVLIEAITTSKVSVADIVDNLTTNVANKPLSAAQGMALKALIDAITIPDKLPNPNALTFTGAVTGSYDGSAPLSVEIPQGGGGGLTVTNTAAVGQTIKVSAVDENGQPTKWEAVDFSSGGDAEKRVRHIATVAVTTGTTTYNVTVDSNGDALNLESVYILTEKFWGSNGSYVQVSVNGKELTRAYGASGSPQALELEKMGELQKLTNIHKPSDVNISFGDYYNGKSAVTSVSFWSAASNVDTTIEIYGVDA